MQRQRQPRTSFIIPMGLTTPRCRSQLLLSSARPAFSRRRNVRVPGLGKTNDLMVDGLGSYWGEVEDAVLLRIELFLLASALIVVLLAQRCVIVRVQTGCLIYRTWQLTATMHVSTGQGIRSQFRITISTPNSEIHVIFESVFRIWQSFIIENWVTKRCWPRLIRDLSRGSVCKKIWQKVPSKAS